MQTSTLCAKQSREKSKPLGIERCNKLWLVYGSFVKLLVPCSSDYVHFMDHSTLKGEKEQCSETSEISLETSM